MGSLTAGFCAFHITPIDDHTSSAEDTIRTSNSLPILQLGRTEQWSKAQFTELVRHGQYSELC